MKDVRESAVVVGNLLETPVHLEVKELTIFVVLR